MAKIPQKLTRRNIADFLAGIELKVLASLILFATGVWAFVELADEVLEGDTHGFDQKILLAMRNATNPSDPFGPPWFEEVMRDVTAVGGMALLTLLSLAVVGFLLLQQKRGMAVLVVASVGGGMLLSAALKFGFDRPRPELVPHGSHVMTTSFPSGHSMLSAVVLLTLGGLLAQYTKKRWIKIYVLSLAVLATLLVGISRVYLGVHWPTDVLAGWAAGASWALLCWFVALWLQKRGRVEEDL